MFTPEALAGYVSDAIMTVINLLIAYAILKWLLFKPLLKLLRNRREKVAAELKEADNKYVQAQNQLNQANQRLDQSNHEAAEIIATARSMAETQNEAILTQARQEAEHIMGRADSELKRLRNAMLQEMRNEVVDLSIAIASKVIGQSLDQDKQMGMISQLIEQEPGLQAESDVKAQDTEQEKSSGQSDHPLPEEVDHA